MGHRDELYHRASEELGRILDRLAAGYEADPSLRLDLRQEIHLQLWQSLQRFDQRCSLKTWALRVAHNVAATWVTRRLRAGQRFLSLEQLEHSLPSVPPPDLDRERALQQLSSLIHSLKPLDRQILLSYLEGLEATAIADITGLSAPNVAMKIHRIKRVLARRFHQEQPHA